MNSKDLKRHVLSTIIDELLAKLSDYDVCDAMFVGCAILKQEGRKLTSIHSTCKYNDDIPVVEMKEVVKDLLLGTRMDWTPDGYQEHIESDIPWD